MEQCLQLCLAFRLSEVLSTFRREVRLQALLILAMLKQRCGNRLVRCFQAGSCLFIDAALVVLNTTRLARNLDEDGVCITAATTSSTLTSSLTFTLTSLGSFHAKLFSREVMDSLQVHHQFQCRLRCEISRSEKLQCRHLQLLHLLLEAFDLGVTLSEDLAVFLQQAQVFLLFFRLKE